MTKMGAMPGRVGFVAALAVLVLPSVAACDQAPSYDYVSACVDHYGNRVADDRCAHAPTTWTHDYWQVGDPEYGWDYIPYGQTVAPIGRPIVGGTRNTTKLTVPGGKGQAPKAASVQRGGGVPAAGGKVQRGGFGVSSGSKGGSGS